MIKAKEEKDKWYKGYFEDFIDKALVAIGFIFILAIIALVVIFITEIIGLKAFIALLIAFVTFYTVAHLVLK